MKYGEERIVMKIFEMGILNLPIGQHKLISVGGDKIFRMVLLLHFHFLISSTFAMHKIHSAEFCEAWRNTVLYIA